MDDIKVTNALIGQMKPIEVIFPKPKRVKSPKAWNSTIPVKSRRIGKDAHRSVKKAGKKKKRVKLPKEPTRPQLIKEFDAMVSDFVLTKICKGKCMRCGKQHKQYENNKGELKWHNYGCSHYWPRDYMGTRFDIDNLDGLCWLPCHSQKWEHDKQGAYKDYMINKLGKRGFNLLEIKARAITKFSTQEIKFMINNFDKIFIEKYSKEK